METDQNEDQNPNHPPSFVTLDESSVRSRYPALLKLFKYRVSSDKRNRDALCLGCNKIESKSKITRLIQHSKRCQACDQVLVKQLIDSYAAYEHRKSGNKNPALPSGGKGKHKADSKKSHKAIDEMIVDLIGGQALPLSLVESVELKKLMAATDSNYELPHKKRLTTILLPARANSCSEAIIPKLKDADKFSVTLEVAGWTDASGASLMAAILKSQKGQAILLDLVDVTAANHSETLLADAVIEAIQKSKLPEMKFNALITDEISNFRAARPVVKSNFKTGNLIEYKSLSHIVNLMNGSITKSDVLKSSMEKLTILMNSVSRNKTLISKLTSRGLAKFYPIPTRWSSTCSCINSAIRLKCLLDKLPQSDEFDYRTWGPIVEDSYFWNDLGSTKGHFDRISQLIGIAESTSATLSRAFRAFLEYGRFINEEVREHAHFNDVFVESYVVQFSQLNLDLMFAAYVLDPNHKMEFLTDKAIKLAKQYMLEMLLEMGHDDDVAKAVLSEFKRYTQVSRSQTRQIDDIYSWWAKSDLMFMKIVAMRLAACPASATNAERALSALGQITTQAGHCLDIDTISDLLSIRLHKQSLQRQGRPPKIQKELSEDQLGEFETEASILDPVILSLSPDLGGDPAKFYESQMYLDFKSLIDYTRNPINEPAVAGNTTTGRDSMARAKALLEMMDTDAAEE